jgi:hypothetical protein
MVRYFSRENEQMKVNYCPTIIQRIVNVCKQAIKDKRAIENIELNDTEWKELRRLNIPNRIETVRELERSHYEVFIDVDTTFYEPEKPYSLMMYRVKIVHTPGKEL